MVLLLIVGGALLVLGLLAYVVAQWPEQRARKKKKDRTPPVDPAVVERNAALAVERADRRVKTLENSLQSAQNEHKEKQKEIDELKAVIGGLERQLVQEKAWREREETLVVKGKDQEAAWRKEVNETRQALHEEANTRIKLEYEVKELRLVKENLAADLRKFIGQNNDYEARVKAFTQETRELKSENAKLRYKKEADQWVAKDDFVALEKQHKAARREIDALRARLPAGLQDVGDRAE